MKNILPILTVFGIVGCSKEITYNCYDFLMVTISKDRTHAKISVGDSSYQRIIQSSIVDGSEISYCDKERCYSFNADNANELRVTGGWATPSGTCQKI